VRFLVDNALFAWKATGLRDHGHDARLVKDYGMRESSDELILERAASEDRVLISADTDFGEILALRRELKPSFILLRLDRYSPPEQLTALASVLTTIELPLREGAVVVLEPARIRIRQLPIVEAE
jgi:predicted nuclease of predicted toxin-antitoxin system